MVLRIFTSLLTLAQGKSSIQKKKKSIFKPTKKNFSIIKIHYSTQINKNLTRKRQKVSWEGKCRELSRKAPKEFQKIQVQAYTVSIRWIGLSTTAFAFSSTSRSSPPFSLFSTSSFSPHIRPSFQTLSLFSPHIDHGVKRLYLAPEFILEIINFIS